MQHIAIYIPDDFNKDVLVHQIANGSLLVGIINLLGLHTELFSHSTLKNFIDAEIKHDHFTIATHNTISLTTSSDGERKKALLAYLISKQPDCIILDNLTESLDTTAQKNIVEQLETIANNILIIQIFNRKEDVLPFIKQYYMVENNQLFVYHPDKITTNVSSITTATIPAPLHHIVAVDNILIELNNVNVYYNEKPILQNICWQIKQGEFWQLIGPNGSGKSTLLSLIIGDNPKGYSQNIMLFGRKKGSGETVWEIKEKMGYFSSAMSFQFDRPDTVEQMIISGFFDSVGLYMVPTDRQVQLAKQWLQVAGMDAIKHKPFRILSLAYQRIILIIRAMVKHPPLLILDEPTAGLNDANTALINTLINKIATETNTAIIYVSHRKEEGLVPQFIYELVADENGSMGLVKN